MAKRFFSVVSSFSSILLHFSIFHAVLLSISLELKCRALSFHAAIDKHWQARE